MEEFEVKALSSFPLPLPFGSDFVDDTFVINKAEHSQELLQHINNQDPHIQFHSGTYTTGLTSFLGHSHHHPTRQPPSALQYMEKPTHTDQYLHWDSNHHITAKQRVYSTPWHIGPRIVSSTQDSLDKELDHIKQHSNIVRSPPGPSTSGTTGSSSHNNSSSTPPTPQQ